MRKPSEIVAADDKPPNKKGVAGEGTGPEARRLIEELDKVLTHEEIGKAIGRSASVVGAIKSGEIANPPKQVVDALKRLKERTSTKSEAVELAHTDALTPRLEEAFLGFFDLDPLEAPEVDDDGVAVVDIMGMIGMNVTASDFVPMIRTVEATKLVMNIDSAGGNAWDGVTIANALRQHAAIVEVNVLGMAASAASVIAMGGDTIIMHPGSMMMTHNARGGATAATAEDCRALAALLEKINVNMADIYAARSGGTQAEWLETMAAETWFTAEEAIEAGLADTMSNAGDNGDGDGLADALDLRAVFGYVYNGRDDAPAPDLAIAALTDPEGAGDVVVTTITASDTAAIEGVLTIGTTTAADATAAESVEIDAIDIGDALAAMFIEEDPGPAEWARAILGEVENAHSD